MSSAAALELPVLLMVFNRPGLTAQVLQHLRQIRPNGLFVSADGPRAGRADDEIRCRAVRALIDGIDWPCDVQRLFHDRNLGCKRGVESAIDWFFENVERGVILEDDCIPDPSFYPYAEALLERYDDDDRVMMISGTNRMGDWPTGYSYHFSRFGHIWAWATWRRAWQRHDKSMKAWEDPAVRRRVAEVIGDRRLFRQRSRQFQAVRSGRLDTWDYGWMLTMLQHAAMTTIPHVNLVSNIGFGPVATHTFYRKSAEANMARYSLEEPLRHPPEVERDLAFDAKMAEAVRMRFASLKLRLPMSVKRRVKLALSLGRA